MSWEAAREYTIPQAEALIKADERGRARIGMTTTEAVAAAVAPLASKKNRTLAEKILNGWRKVLKG